MSRSLGKRAAIGVLIGVVVSAVVWSATMARSGRPIRSGTIPLPGLSDSVTVDFDRWGVPSIRGSNAEDVARALGYIHANDRMAQMELGRRAAFGELSELVGEAAVPLDTAMRRLRLRVTAEKMLRRTSLATLQRLQAYAAGVNAYLEQRGDDLTPALRILGSEPRPWRPVDSFAFALLMARDLSFWNDRPKEARFGWLAGLGRDRALGLVGDSRAGLDPQIEALARSVSLHSREAPASGALPGSNNWGLGGFWTRSERALIANDPHLALRLPSIWYQVILDSPEYRAAGVTIAGAPAVIIGRGPRIAWALTNVMLDDHDLFFEELDPTGTRFRRGDAWHRLHSRTETIHVRDGKSVEIEVATTDIGPLLPADPARGLPPRSLAWTALHDLGDPLSMFSRLAMAPGVDSISEIVEEFSCPAQNLVATDVDGGVGWWVIGAIPERRSGAGRFPRAAWDLANHWSGVRPKSGNPRLVSTDGSAFLATANDELISPTDPHPFAADYYSGHRGRRIRERLAESQEWSLETTAELQLDSISRFAREVVLELEKVAELSQSATRARSVLSGWDAAMTASGPSALFAVVERRLLESVFADEAEVSGAGRFATRDRLLRLLQGDLDESWFDDVRTSVKVETRREIVDQVLRDSWSEVVGRWNSEEPERWAYRELNLLTLRHPLDSLPVVGSWMRRGPFPVAGSATAIAAFGGRWRGDHIEIVSGPSMRWILDWGDSVGHSILPGGQSGHPLDRHYDDQLEDYFAGRLHPLLFEAAKPPSSRLRFEVN